MKNLLFLFLLFCLLSSCVENKKEVKNDIKEQGVNINKKVEKESIELNKYRKDTVLPSFKNENNLEASKLKSLEDYNENNEIVYRVLESLKYEEIVDRFKIVSIKEQPNKYDPSQIDRIEKLVSNYNDVLFYYRTNTKNILCSGIILNAGLLRLEGVVIGMSIDELSERLHLSIPLETKEVVVSDFEGSMSLIFNLNQGRLVSVNLKVGYIG
ncbi:hypothetical protein [Wenyingzhuangia sp. IMCC45574]